MPNHAPAIRRSRNTRAIVTLALDDMHVASWKQFCEAHWRRYAERYGYDLICLQQPLDTSERARTRSTSWQKCLIAGQPFARSYEQLVWLDADILINNRTAPDVAAGVPLDRVGGVEKAFYSSVDPTLSRLSLERAYEMWPDAIVNYSAREYYTNYGPRLAEGFDQVIDGGVLVMAPTHHRELFEHVYYSYEEKIGREWHMEMRPLSYEIVKSGSVHWLDPRFNTSWTFMKIVYYPYLVRVPTPGERYGRIKNKLDDVRRSRIRRRFSAAAVNAAYQLSYFLHFGDMHTDLMSMVNPHANWRGVEDVLVKAGAVPNKDDMISTAMNPGAGGPTTRSSGIRFDPEPASLAPPTLKAAGDSHVADAPPVGVPRETPQT